MRPNSGHSGAIESISRHVTDLDAAAAFYGALVTLHSGGERLSSLLVPIVPPASEAAAR